MPNLKAASKRWIYVAYMNIPNAIFFHLWKKIFFFTSNLWTRTSGPTFHSSCGSTSFSTMTSGAYPCTRSSPTSHTVPSPSLPTGKRRSYRPHRPYLQVNDGHTVPSPSLPTGKRRSYRPLTVLTYR